MNSERTMTDQVENDLTGPMGSLIKSLDKWTLKKSNEPASAYPPLSIYRYEAPTELTSYMLEPSICLIAQGRKRVLLGEDEYVYDQDHYLITAVDLPLVAQILEASPQKPYLGLTLRVEKKQIAHMILDDNLSIHRTQPAERGLAVSKLTQPIVKAFRRLVELLDTPDDIPVLGPLIQQEILYRLLRGELGQRLQQISMVGSHSHQIARAIDWLKGNYDKTFKVDDLAAYTGMSSSSLHFHFRALTSMSPLQFQKRLRLNEARQLMLMEQKDATSAAFEVGYESPSQFSREYRRLFGAPPLQDIKQLLEADNN